MTVRTLDGKVALVTGAASGIGRATALALADQGAAVAALDLNASGTRDVADEIAHRGGAAGMELVADLADPDAIALAVARVLAQLGRIDILANVAGIALPGDDLLGLHEDTWDRTYRVNLKAPALLLHHVARHMVDRGGGGRVVNVSSSSAYRGEMAPLAYAASKAGVVALTRIAAAELGPYGVNVNAVVPGVTRTPILGEHPPEELDAWARSGPLRNFFGRISDPEDVAAVIVFLCLPESRQITGQAIHTSAGAVV
jgi:NAD(P)-dependent dehydrogenase (short-subunit alcohol dehydrogenase family)